MRLMTSMSRLFLASVATAAAVGEAILPLKLIRIALGFPPSLCPSGALAAAIIVGHFVALAAFVFVVLALVRRASPTPWTVVWAGVAGSLTASIIIWCCFAQPQVWSWVLGVSRSLGGAWDAARWIKAVGTGVGGLLGVALARARQNGGLN